jgi:ParB-like chromosome segregation protein Spo0J
MSELVAIDKIIVPEHTAHRMNVDDLARDIDECGLINPIILDQDYVVLAGFRRLKAFQQLGRKEIPAIIRSNPIPEIFVNLR